MKTVNHKYANPLTYHIIYLGDVIHLYGFYPDTGATTNQRPSSSHRPASSYKPTYNYGDAPRPQQWEHDGNHLQNPSLFYASSNNHRPVDNHRPSVGGLVSGDGSSDYGVDADDLFGGNGGNAYGNGQHFPVSHSSDEGTYRPVQGKSI